MTRTRRCPITATAAAVATVLAGGLPRPSPAGQVVAGQAQINQQGKTTLIQQQSQRAILHWQAFGVKAGELVRFDLPASTAAVLNRVVGPTPASSPASCSPTGGVSSTRTACSSARRAGADEWLHGLDP